MKRIVYQGTEYNKKTWLAYLCNFKRLNNNYFLREYHKNFTCEEIIENFKKNIKISTFYRLILPCALFLVLFLITIVFSFLFENNGNLATREYYNIKVYLIFLSVFFLFVGLNLLIRIVYKKEKCYFGRNFNKNQIYYLKKKEIEKIIEAINNFYNC